MSSRAFAMATGTLILAAFSVAGQEGSIRNRADLRTSLAAARTAADRAGTAVHYRQAAQFYRQKQAEEERIAAQAEAIRTLDEEA